MNVKRLALATLAVFLVSTAFIMATCASLFSWIYEIEPLIWLTPEQMMDTSSMIASNLVGLVSSFFWVLVFAVLYKGIPGKGIKKGLMYGFLIWLAASFKGIASMPFYMTIAEGVIMYWLVSGLLLNLLLGTVTAAIYKK